MKGYKFKVGDKVRFTEKRRQQAKIVGSIVYMNTQIATVLSVVLGGTAVYIKFPNEKSYLFCYNSSIEKANLPNFQLSFDFMEE